MRLNSPLRCVELEPVRLKATFEEGEFGRVGLIRL
jgi:hypothetical protein